MNRASRHVVVTGAAGFIGSRLVGALLGDAALGDIRLTLNDLTLVDAPADPRVRRVAGNFGDPDVLAEIIDDRVDILFHIGGVLGGAAEANPVLARQVNIDATLALLEALRDEAAPTRVVFASSIAVFGTPLPSSIDDETRPNPAMLYGAQKAMIEVAIEQASTRGWIDGIALRLPGVVVKPGADARMKAAFLNRLFEAFVQGDDFVLPVSPDGTTWLLSADACIEALLLAGRLPSAALGQRRAFTLPAQNVRFRDLVAALHARYPNSATRIDYRPDPQIELQFGRQPPLTTALADALGFRHDGDVATLVSRAQ